MDIRPPKKRPQQTPINVPTSTPGGLSQLPAVSLITAHAQPRKKPWWKRLGVQLAIVLGVLAVASGALISSLVWYQWALSAPSDDTREVRIVVESGETAASIANNLHDHDLIRSRLAFNIYTYLSGARPKLQAGGYVLAPNQDAREIVDHLTSGKTDEFNITILPGLTLDELRTQFIRDGFGDEEITEAFEAPYEHPLLATKPADATLEGYIFPETYRMNADQSLRELIERSFDEIYSRLQESKYLEEFARRKLSIHDGLTLASIVQKEVKDPTDQKQVAQVFLTRLGIGMQLGSDVTYMYAAKQMGVEGTPSLESPYNTRKYAGLPPGPIANMNPSAIDAVAFPAPGDFLYFVAGDDGKTYFSKTEAEHEANVRAHCTALCQ
ncbi:MAG: endolytic transglycosylase MltG [Candidatus Saccharimonadales bacterium]